LVLDLDETLVHYDWHNKQFKIRPYARTFLQEMSKFFEIVIFTAAHQNYADFIIDCLDPNKDLIQHRLYR
jgi:CTD small phosphatase-like protein 2